MYSTSHFSKFAAAVLVVGLTSISSLQPASAPADGSATAATENEQAPSARVLLAQFNPCPNRKCR